MIRLFRAVDLFRLERTVDFVEFLDGEDANGAVLGLRVLHPQSRLPPLAKLGGLRFRNHERDGNREHPARGEAHLLNDRQVVSPPHESREWRKHSGRDELGIRPRARIEHDARQMRCAGEDVPRFVSSRKAVYEHAPVGCDPPGGRACYRRLRRGSPCHGPLPRSLRVRYHCGVFTILEASMASRKAQLKSADPAVFGGELRPRDASYSGDELGAAELGRRVAENLRQRRKSRGMSLEDLSKASGVSRAALSQVETCKSNPTVGLLWKIAVGLGVPFSELIGESAGAVSVLRRGEAQVLRSVDGKFESRPLAPAGISPLVELYELRLAARSLHASEPHAPGTRELLVVLSGVLRMHISDELHQLAAGDSIAFQADVPHAYENPGGSEARYHNVIVYER